MPASASITALCPRARVAKLADDFPLYDGLQQ